MHLRNQFFFRFSAVVRKCGRTICTIVHFSRRFLSKSREHQQKDPVNGATTRFSNAIRLSDFWIWHGNSSQSVCTSGSEILKKLFHSRSNRQRENWTIQWTLLPTLIRRNWISSARSDGVADPSSIKKFMLEPSATMVGLKTTVWIGRIMQISLSIHNSNISVQLVFARGANKGFARSRKCLEQCL